MVAVPAYAWVGEGQFQPATAAQHKVPRVKTQRKALLSYRCASHGVRTFPHIHGSEHLKIIKRKKTFELNFMAESACLEGPGLVGKADASQAAETERKEAPAELSTRSGLS